MHDADVTGLILRVTLGVVMVAHGWNHLSGPGGVSGTAGWFESMGLRPPRVHALASGAVELVSGVGLVAGLLTALDCGAVVGVMTVALVTAHRRNGFFIFKEGQGWEYVAVLALGAVALAILGPGRISIDHAIDLDVHLRGAAGAALSAGLGLAGALGLLVTCWRPPRPTVDPEPDYAPVDLQA